MDMPLCDVALSGLLGRLQTEDILSNPQNPGSEPSVRVNFNYKTYFMQHPNIVGTNRIRPLMIQINFPICGTMAFVIHSKGMFACYLNGDFVGNG
jgi:hypothetical protein